MTQRRSQVQITFSEDVVELPPMEPEIQVRVPVWAWGAALAIITFIAFAPALPGKFLPQDDANITENPLLRSWMGLKGVWRFAHTQPQVSPLGYTLLRCEYWMWPQPHAPMAIGGAYLTRFVAGYHLVSLLLHIAGVLLFWTLLRKLELRGAFVAAVIFAVHPVQVQTVAWISQQPALLGMVLGLMSLIVYLRFCGVNSAPMQPSMFRLPEAPWALYSIALVLFVLAILAKPAMAVLSLVVLILIWWDRGKIARGDWIAIAPMLAISLFTFIGGVLVVRQEVVEHPMSAIQRIGIVGPALWFYLYSLVRPGTFSFVYLRWNPTAWWGWLMLLAVIAILVALWIRRDRWGRAPLAGALLFVAILVPQVLFVDVAQLREAYVADSVMYAALAAVSAAGVSALCEWLLPRGRELSPRLAAPWMAACCLLLAVGTTFWLAQSYRSPERLWATAIARTPNSVYALNQLGALELKQQKLPLALDHFRRALTIDPADTETMRNLGAYYEALRDPDRAYGQYFAAVNRDSTDVVARCGMARALAAKGDPLAAIREYENVLRQRPEYEIALNDMAMIYADLGRFDDALECYRRAIRAVPSYIPSHINLANLHFRMGNYQQAVDELAATQKIDAANFVVYVNIGAMCGELSDKATEPDQKKTLLRQSEIAFRQALYLNPDSAQAAHNLAVALARQASADASQAGKLREAVFYFNKACMLEPENKDFAAHLRDAQRQASTMPS